MLRQRQNSKKKRNAEDGETCRIFVKLYENEESNSRRTAKLWLERSYDNNTASTKTGYNEQQG